MEQDLNISNALAFFLGGVTAINQDMAREEESLNSANLEAAIEYFKKTDQLFGFDIASIESIPGNVKTALEQYTEARKTRDFTKSDLMRQKIVELGWLVKDGRPGEPSTVKKVRRAWDIKK